MLASQTSSPGQQQSPANDRFQATRVLIRLVMYLTLTKSPEWGRSKSCRTRQNCSDCPLSRIRF